MMRFFLPIYFLVAMLTLVAYRSLRLRQQTGASALAFTRDDPLDGYIAKVFLLTELAVMVSIVAYAIGGDFYAALAPVEWVAHAAAQWTAGGVLVVALLWTMVAQAQMGASWRIGIDRKHQTDLVTHGVFRFSRNPIFLAMRVSLLSFFFCTPNAVSLATALVGNALLQVQVRLEEKHLEALHGDNYRRYKSKVRRWL
ncbi:MAG: isoprenylcysteine carboxylmethyltransferase family protein [Myxococcales bacterium]|nr:isoprenylcysteine carboxylmethyltransferase family protein [Myxococcales bacterium]